MHEIAHKFFVTGQVELLALALLGVWLDRPGRKAPPAVYQEATASAGDTMLVLAPRERPELR